MNQKAYKSTHVSSCSTKKSSNKGIKTQSQPKKNLQNTFAKLIVPSARLANSSVLTQRINVHTKCKLEPKNQQSQKTLRAKSSSKKLTKAISKMKTDRKAEYVKLKAKQFESQLGKQISQGKENFKKATKQPKPTLNQIKYFETAGQDLNLEIKFAKSSSFLHPQTENQTSMKKRSEQIELSQISKNQKHLIEKISFLQRQNYALSQKNDSLINEIKYKHDEQVTNLREEMKILSSRLNQQGNKNLMAEKKAQVTEKEYISLRQKLQQKDKRILYLQKEKTGLQQQLNIATNQIMNYKAQAISLSSNITELKSLKTQLEEQITKCEKEKLFIKQNCTQVLSILRQEFGQELKLFSF